MAGSRLYKRLIYFILTLTLLILLGFGALVAWVVTGPRSINALTPYIESALAPPGSDYKINIENSILIWDGWSHPIGIRIKNVDVLGSSGISVAHFPEVGVRMYFLKLLRGKVDLKSIELLNPVVKLVQDDKGNITSLGFSDDSSGSGASLAAALTLLTSEQGDNPMTHLKFFTIRHASLSVTDSHGAAFFASPNASVEITREHGTASGRLRMPLEFNGKRSEIDIRFMLNGNNRTVSSDIVFSDVASTVLAALAPSQKWMSGVKLQLSGWANVSSDFDANIDAIDFTVESDAGTVDFPGQFEHVLAPRHIRVKGKLTDKLATLTVGESVLDFPDHSLTFSGTAHKVGEDYGVDADVESTAIAIDDIHAYWPLSLAPHSRSWVTTRISKGKIVKANVALHFKPGEFKLKDTPEAAVDANIAIRGATIKYKPGNPPITDIDGSIHFTGRTMDAKLSSAKYLNDTHIFEGHVRFPDFYPDDVRLFIDMELATTAGDVQHFLSLPDLDKAVKLGLTPDAAGQMSGNAKLDFIAFSENEKDDVSATGKINYTVNATLKGVSQKRFLGNRDVADANMKLSLDNKGIKLSGKARINTVPMSINLTSSFSRKNETTYEIRANVPVARLSDFGLPEIEFAKGNLGVHATFYSAEDAEKADATVDLADASIFLAKHGLDKKAGQPGTLEVNTERLSTGNTLIKSFAFKSEGYDIGGSAEYDRSMNDFSRFTLTPLRLGKTDLDALSFERHGRVIRLSGQGRAFDASRYLADAKGNDGDTDYLIGLRAKKLILGEGRELKEVMLEADCPTENCRTVRLGARLKDGTPLSYIISGGRLSASCGNAGEFAQLLGLTDAIEGGKMTMTGQYNQGQLEGLLEVKDYTLKKAPVATRIFTIASLTGILDTLSGNGIYFDRLSAPFVYHRGAIILKEAKTHGSALGLTADGVVDTNKSTLDITGVLVPSYTLNSLIGHVPVIGDLITGGSGKGLVALSYGIHGSMSDPSIRVNPLSVLTPGFLRNVFTIFDKPVPDMSALEAAEKNTPDPAAGAATPGGASAPQSAPPVAPASPQLNPSLPSVNELKQ